MIWLAAIAGYFIVTGIVVVAVCALSAQISEHEDWREAPIVESHAETASARDYKVDTAPSS